MRQKIATLYYLAKMVFLIMIFFYIYITIDSVFLIVFMIFLSYSYFKVIVLIQFCIILVRNGMFYKKTKSIKFGYHFLLLDTVYIYS